MPNIHVGQEERNNDVKILEMGGKKYRLPNGLTEFQTSMYVHLINWKWDRITKEPGKFKKKDGNGVLKTYEYDAILPESTHESFPLIYPSILNDLKNHQNAFKFKFHEHFNHMASSQAANINLFLPLLLNSHADEIFSRLKSDFKSIERNELYKGFRIEFWDGNSNKEKGLLKDHSAIAGTDADIAIAYRNHYDELCLWLIEHKLTEKEFTQCGGAKSKGKNASHDCTKTFDEILNEKGYCYYHSGSRYEYWNLTDSNKGFFTNASNFKSCPFIGGLNQLWRNQLLGFAIEKQGKFKKVFFSVVKHPENNALNASLIEYSELIDNNHKFSFFDSEKVVSAALKSNNTSIHNWAKWYNELYKL